MRWLVIAFLVSIAALLLAAAGLARHIWLQRSRLHSNPDIGLAGNTAASPAIEEVDHEIEP